MRRIRRIGLGLGLAALLPMLGGCYGSFALVQKVHKFNGEISKDKWAREGLFLVFIFPFTPVYSLATFFDAIFFNAVEFWTGEQLIANSDEATSPKRATDSPVVDTTVDTSAQPAQPPRRSSPSSAPSAPRQNPKKKR